MGSASYSRSVVYDSYGFATSQTAGGLTTTMAADSFGNLASVTDAHSHVNSTTHQVEEFDSWSETLYATNMIMAMSQGLIPWSAERLLTALGPTVFGLLAMQVNGAITVMDEPGVGDGYREVGFEIIENMTRHTFRTPGWVGPKVLSGTNRNAMKFGDVYDHERVRVVAHTHPSAQGFSGSGSAGFWPQLPDQGDKNGARTGALNMVISEVDRQIYLFDSTGTLGTIPLSLFRIFQ